MVYIVVSIYRKALIFVKKYALEDFSNGNIFSRMNVLEGEESQEETRQLEEKG